MICTNCVTPQKLKEFINSNELIGICNYCNQKGQLIDHHAFFNHIIKLVKENIATEEDLTDFEHGLIYQCGSGEISVTGIDIVLSEWFELGNDPYFDDLYTYIPESLYKNEYNDERHYYSDDGSLEKNIYDEKWDQFIADIRHSHRFFNPNAKGFLDSVFSPLSGIDGKLRPEIVRTLSRGQMLYRARTAQNKEAAKRIAEKPHIELGPAPKEKAGSQRMTPNGISSLYCALDRNTCLSEIRSITGDEVVSVALTPTHKLKLLDLTKLDLIEYPILTHFEEGYRDSLHLKAFLKSMVKKMSKPKGRNDDLSYLSTQVVFEHLRLGFGSQVDGMLFPSVQTGEVGTNVVLFPESSSISNQQYAEPNEVPDNFIENPFNEPNAKLAITEGSLRFHRIKAIKTEAITYGELPYLYLNENRRSCLGFDPETNIDDATSSNPKLIE